MAKKIAKSNLVKEFNRLVELLGFQKQLIDNHVYEKKYHDGNCCVRVDFLDQKIIYPEDKDFIVNDKTTCNFSAPENMVVLECVDRLLTKGYRPEHIELEKRWKLGHSSKSGKADIYVKDNDGNSLIIIECKTYGAEYNKELKNIDEDGGQLFSYWQQEKKTAWICLYTSIVQDSEIKYGNEVIRCKDDENLIELAKSDKSILLYDFAKNVSELHEAWKNTYGCKKEGDVIFGADSIAYKIGIKPLRKKDLIAFDNIEGVVNKFEEILRHNNVSDKENAFNRLIALFICKLVDEIRKDDDDEVEFQYKIGTDKYESLQDRLQKLHKEGMEDFMSEDIFYVPDDYADKLFINYTGHNRKRAIAELNETIRILKFYTNNDFSFKDVHNEELFRQNGKIIVEIVQLFQKYRIVYPSKQQILGDLFEQLLDKGFKQSEGQFFTPVPIARFIWDSLPLERYKKEFRYPKVIDYACGSGHFLTEAVEAINEICACSKSNDWTRHSIYGVEKDYRLARVSKISMFMNGAGESNIIFGDGLDNSPYKGIDNGKFDILVANPPYAVKSIKSHLNLKNNNLETLNYITNDSGDIQNCFIERAVQLLKPRGLAAIILPVSNLTNRDKSFNKSRDILFRNFYLKCMFVLGKKTFGATDTVTVILFLEKMETRPDHAGMMMDYVDSVISGRVLDDWRDRETFDSYLDMIGVSEKTYRELLQGEIDESNAYSKLYEKLRNTTAHRKGKGRKNVSIVADADSCDFDKQAFASIITSIEREKLLYHAVTRTQETLIITAPEDKDECANFLGYTWSNRKASEGRKDINYGGCLFNRNDRRSNDVLAGVVRSCYEGKESCSKNESILQYVKVLKSTDLVDFSSVPFSNVISIVEKTNPLFVNHALVSLDNEEYFTIINGKRVVSSQMNDMYRIPVYSANVITPVGYINESLLSDFSEPSVLWGIDGDWMVNYIEENIQFYPTDHCGVIRVNSMYARPRYIAALLEYEGERIRFSRSNRASSSRIKQLKLPLLTLDKQDDLCAQISNVDGELEACLHIIESSQQKLEEMASSAIVDASSPRVPISECFELCKGVTFSAAEKVYTRNGISVLTADNVTLGGWFDIRKVVHVNSSVEFSDEKRLRKGDCLMCFSSGSKEHIGKVCLIDEDTEYYAGGFMGILRSKRDIIKPEYLHLLLNSSYVQNEIKSKCTGANINNLSGDVFGMLLPVPAIDVQHQITQDVIMLRKKIKGAYNRLITLREGKRNIIERFFSE